ncbi:MAG: Ribosome-releasing factor 2, mitochondrial [Cirrosporium novae-zelandiae]|nr:MAG: Ribosome-releasing factor 2, mitochondrial [Cirrosporium novae-zelandiae]
MAIARTLTSNWICYACRHRLLRSTRPLNKQFSSSALRWNPQNTTDSTPDLLRIRNLGIIAHIDAGKTTTTERMLYYSGYTRRIGDVDDGSTVTDFLPAERARGITIQSAAITFEWPPVPRNPDLELKNSSPPNAKIVPASTDQHSLNLIDTPGHADFNFEVLRSLRVLDGAVCILDGVAGVEAQTENVWHQARNYKIPSIIYINKLDRDGAAFGKTVKEIGSRLHSWPAVCQIPWFENGNGRFTGVVDVVRMKGLLWDEGGDGRTCKVLDMAELEAKDPALAEEAKKARTALVEVLSENDDELIDQFLNFGEDHLAIPPADIAKSLRKCVLDPAAAVVPVFAGASFRNIGVQPLLDGAVQLLPNPTETPDPEVSIGDTKGGLTELLNGQLVLREVSDGVHHKEKGKNLTLTQTQAKALIQKMEGCALAFKVVNDAKRGVLIYVRVYSGVLNKNALLYNTNLHVSERAPRLLKMYANDAIEIPSIAAGQIGVIVGLKHARTGDTLVSCRNVSQKAGPPAPLNSLQLRPINIPPPVFFAAIEPNSLSEEKNVSDALALLLREDPSLHVSVDPDSGQTLLSGMGELHLEIARDRLVKDFKAKCTMGKIEIGYRESILETSQPIHRIFDRVTAGKPSKAGCTATVSPWNPDSDISSLPKDSTLIHEGNLVTLSLLPPDHPHHRHPTPAIDPSSLPAHLPLKTIQRSLLNGALAALARGPKHHFPIHSTHISLFFTPSTDIFGTDTTASSLVSAARVTAVAALKAATEKAGGNTALMEPVMRVTISVDETSMGAVIHDISSARGGHVLALGESASHMDQETSNTDSTSQSSPSSPSTPLNIARIYAPRDPFASSNANAEEEMGNVQRRRDVEARVPLREMVGYLKHLRSLTGGRGTFVMQVDRFEKVGGQREKAVLEEVRFGGVF